MRQKYLLLGNLICKAAQGHQYFPQCFGIISDTHLVDDELILSLVPALAQVQSTLQKRPHWLDFRHNQVAFFLSVKHVDNGGVSVREIEAGYQDMLLGDDVQSMCAHAIPEVRSTKCALSDHSMTQYVQSSFYMRDPPGLTTFDGVTVARTSINVERLERCGL